MRQREGEVYVMDADGTNTKRLTDVRSWDGSPEWSGDGKTIYFYSARPRELPASTKSHILGQEGGFRIWAMDRDGSNQRAVTPVGVEALAPALTHDDVSPIRPGARSSAGICNRPELDGTDPRLESDEAGEYWNPDYHHTSGAMVVCHGVRAADHGQGCRSRTSSEPVAYWRRTIRPKSSSWIKPSPCMQCGTQRARCASLRTQTRRYC